MSFRRRWVVYGLVAVVLGGNLVSFIFNDQLWPYSPYPMFADAREEDQRTFETLALVGEPVAGGEIWFESQGYLSHGLSPMVINSGFRGSRARPGMNGLDEQLRETYQFYERRRRQGRSNAPPLRRLHLYRFSWTLRQDLANLRTPRRTLIASYPSDDRPGQ
jgi:hypothetical protein